MATMWSSESARDPYLALALATSVTEHVKLGTGIAVAYGRPPYATAQAAWHLQQLSGGRFQLGLATQVRAHIERRYGMPWPGGVGAFREYILCCRAIWNHWQFGTSPDFEGEHYRFTLSNPEFRPAPLPGVEYEIPLWVAGVGPRMVELAGELGQGLHVHAFHTPSYLSEVLLPAAHRGRRMAGRPEQIDATCPVFAGIVHDGAEESVLRENVRQQIAFYASTPAYVAVLEHEGYAGIHEPARQLAREKRWHELAGLVDDSLVDRFAIFDTPRELALRLRARYDGLLTEVGLYRGGDRFASPGELAEFVGLLGA
ncbi:MAG: luciferase-like protein [Subtercola sp.]|nr:luciferase-like protein [Subtercola sp.]